MITLSYILVNISCSKILQFLTIEVVNLIKRRGNIIGSIEIQTATSYSSNLDFNLMYLTINQTIKNVHQIYY